MGVFHRRNRSNVVRLRGLPFSANEADIRDFFNGFEFGPDGILIQLNFQGRSTGQAYVQFANAEQANKALELNRQHMGSRYIEVFKGHPADMQAAMRVAARSNSFNGPSGLSTGISTGLPGFGDHGIAGTGVPGMSSNLDMRYSGVVRMRGMPYSATAADITAFFKGMMIVPDGIFLCTHSDGRPTGEAYVEFASEEIANHAMQLHREQMGSRYVELFRSTKAEMMSAVQQRMYGMLSSGGGFSQFSGMNQLQGMMGGFGLANLAGSNLNAMQMASLNMHSNLESSTSENSFLKLRGLPYTAGMRDIYDFFDGYRIVPGGIHIVLGPTDRPTGEAYVEFISPQEASRAMERHRKNIGSRYIELFRANRNEVLMALGGNALANFNMAASLDPHMQLLLLQQQQLQAAAMGWNFGDFQNQFHRNLSSHNNPSMSSPFHSYHSLKK